MPVEVIVGLAALFVGIGCVLAGIYIFNIYRQRTEEALFLTRLVHRDIRVSIAAAAVAALVAISYLSEPLPRPWGAIVLGLAVIVMEWGPISDALLWRKERKSGFPMSQNAEEK